MYYDVYLNTKFKICHKQTYLSKIYLLTNDTELDLWHFSNILRVSTGSNIKKKASFINCLLAYL